METEPLMPEYDPLMPNQSAEPVVEASAIPQEVIEEELNLVGGQIDEPQTETQVAGPLIREILRSARESIAKGETPQPQEKVISSVRLEPSAEGQTLVIDTPRQQDVDSLRKFLGDKVDLTALPRPNLSNKERLSDVEKDYLVALNRVFDERFTGVANKQTIQEMIEDAQELGMDSLVAELMELKPGQAFNKVGALRAEFISANILHTVMSAAEEGDTQTLKHAVALFGSLAPRIESGISEGAGAMAVRSHVGRTLDIPGDLGAISDIFKRYDNSGIGDEETEQIRILIKTLPPAQQMKFLSKVWVGVNKGLNMIGEAYISSILSSPVTQAVNIVANSAFLLYQIPERALAGGIGSARKKIVDITGWQGGIGYGRVKTNLLSGLSSDDQVYAKEALVMAAATNRGIVNAIKAAAKAFVTEQPQFGKKGFSGDIEGASKVDLSDDQTKAISADYLGIERTEGAPFLTKDGQMNALGKFVDMVGIAVRALGPRMLLTEDEFAKGIAHQWSMESETYRRIQRFREEGMDDDALRIEAQRMLSGMDENVNDAATKFALEMTFQQNLEGFQKRIGKLFAHPLAKPVMAFYKTPQWVANEIVARSPLFAFTPRFARAMRTGGAEADLAMSRALMGTGLMVPLAYLASGEMIDGVRITGAYPEDRAVRDAWIRAKVLPYSIGIRQDNGEWFQVSIDRFQPISAQLAMAADVSYFTQYGSDDDTAAMFAMAGATLAEDHLFVQTAKSTGKQLGTMPMLQGVADVMEILGEEYQNFDARIARAEQILAKRYAAAGMAAATPYSGLLASIERSTEQGKMKSNVKPTDEQLNGRYYTSNAKRGWYEALNRAKSRTPILSNDVEPRLNLYGQEMPQCTNGVWCGISPIRVETTQLTGAVREKAGLIDKEMIALGLGVRAPKRTQRGIMLSAQDENEMLRRLNAPMENRGVNDNELMTMIDEMFETINLSVYAESYKGDKIKMLQKVVSERLNIVLDEMFEMIADPDRPGRKKVSDEAFSGLAEKKRLYDKSKLMLGKPVPQSGYFWESDQNL